MARFSLVQQVHQLLARLLQPGDIAIDATVGNGHDTLFLARCVGAGGKVYGFDIQQQALDSAWQRLEQAGETGPVSLYHAGHETMRFVVPASVQGRVRAVMFNLGYLPGGDKGRTTSASTTLAALQAALGLLAPGGVISLLAYTGHPGGRDEAELVKSWSATLALDLFEVILEVPPGMESAPEWLWIRRRR
ncbi:MAG: 16S rRNA (cytosine(1402)-N(4))-methyltransferase [Chromatiales bacterium]|nr:16S rRNA (cytosine(1402)-N(4))-methyltransferase [Chromatiales bacterium]